MIVNVSTLTDCLDECASYNFRTPSNYFPAWACTGVSWGAWDPLIKSPAPVCWLKGNFTLGSPDGTYLDNKYDSAVMLYV